MHLLGHREGKSLVSDCPSHFWCQRQDCFLPSHHVMQHFGTWGKSLQAYLPSIASTTVTNQTTKHQLPSYSNPNHVPKILALLYLMAGSWLFHEYTSSASVHGKEVWHNSSPSHCPLFWGGEGAPPNGKKHAKRLIQHKATWCFLTCLLGWLLRSSRRKISTMQTFGWPRPTQISWGNVGINPLLLLDSILSHHTLCWTSSNFQWT